MKNSVVTHRKIELMLTVIAVLAAIGSFVLALLSYLA
jgi:hypothetical protein